MPEATKTIMLSGFCSSGWHEGKRPKDFNGNPAPVCTMWNWCKCSCHVAVTEFYKEHDLPREDMDNPDYHPHERTWLIPKLDYELLPSEAKMYAEILPCDRERYRHLFEDVAPDVPGEVVTGTVNVRAYPVTPTGITAPGQLEAWVLEVFQEWLRVHEPHERFTPPWVSNEIARVQRVKAPSPGAVRAVCDRWVKYNYVTIETSPYRVTGLTQEGQQYSLSFLRDRWKRMSKS